MNNALAQLQLYDPKEDLPLYANPVGALYRNAPVAPTAAFAAEFKRVTFETEPAFGRTVWATLPADGDYFRALYLEIGLPALPIAPGSTYTGWTNGVAFALVSEVRITFDGKDVNVWDGALLRLLWEQQVPVKARDAVVGLYATPADCQNSAAAARTVLLEIPWLNGQTLPRRAMPMVAVRVKVVFAPFDACVTYDGPTALDPLAYPFQQDSVALNLERLYVPSIVAALIPTEASLLFDQYQTVTATTAMGREVTVPLEFSHPTKTITFTLQDQSSVDNNDQIYVNYDTGLDLLHQAKLLVVGSELVKYRSAFELNRTVVWNKYPNPPRAGVYVLPFCDAPTTVAPSGSINLTKGSTQELHLQLVTGGRQLTVKVYAQVANWLDIKDGKCVVRWL